MHRAQKGGGGCAMGSFRGRGAATCREGERHIVVEQRARGRRGFKTLGNRMLLGRLPRARCPFPCSVAGWSWLRWPPRALAS
jgi:hypothetical protein